MQAGTETVAPKTSTKTTLSYSTTLTGNKTQVGYLQEIPEFLKAPESIVYSAIDIDDERSAKGRRKAEDFEPTILFTEEQWDELRAIETAGTPVYWFIQFPPETALETGKPVTFYFKGTIALGVDVIAIDEMLKTKIKIYRSTKIEESKGFPTVEPANG